MSALRDLAKDFAKDYHLTNTDAKNVIGYILDNITQRLLRGEVVHIEKFGSFHAENGKVWFNPSDHMEALLRTYRGPKVQSEKKRGMARWKELHQAYLQKLEQQKQELDSNNQVDEVE